MTRRKKYRMRTYRLNIRIDGKAVGVFKARSKSKAALKRRLRRKGWDI